MALLAQDSSEARNSELKSVCGQLVSLGLFPELNDPEKPVSSEAQSEMLFGVLTQPGNADILRMNDKAPMASAALHNVLADLQQILDAAKPKEGALADDGYGRNRAQYAYPARGKAVPAGLLAGMAMNAPVNASFGIVSEAMKALELQISASLELAANGVAIGADIFPGGVTMLAGAGMIKDGVFKHNRLQSIRPSYERALGEYRTIQQEISSLHEEMKTRIGGAGRDGASSQQAVMDHISQVIGPRVNTLQSRLLAIDNELRRATIDAMSGAALAGAGATGLASAIVKTAATTAAGATAASAMGMAAGGLLTVLGAFQLGMSINELRRLRHDFAAAHAQRGRGEDSGLRRAHMIRTNELVEAHKRKIRLWTAFTAGSTAMTAGGALMATGVAAAGGAALSGAGAVAVAGSVYSLFHEPRDLRNRAARAADNTADTRDAVINNDRLLNLFLHKNANQANRAAEAINEIVDNALDDTTRALSSSGKEFRHQFKKTANVRSWFDIDAQRRILSKRIESRLDATKDQQLILMTYTNIQELDYLKQELASVRNEVAEIDSAIAITRALLLKNHQHLESLKARNAPAPSPDTATDEVRESGTELQTQIRHADALQKRLQVQVAQLQSAKRMVTPRLERTESRYRAVSDLQNRLDLFGSELDRDFRASTREQFDDLRLRFMLTNHLLVSAMGRKEAKLLAQAHHLDRLDAGNEAQSFMKAYIDGRLFDGKNDVGPVPIKGKLERIDIEPSEACLAWLKSPREGGTTPRVGDINRLFATAMCVSLPDRCADERNIVLDMHTERLKLYLAEQQKAQESPRAAVSGGKRKTRIKAAVSEKMGALSEKLQLRSKPVPARGAAEVAGAAAGVRPAASSSSSTRTVELAATREAETQARRARQNSSTKAVPPVTAG
ncbi:hypothetical protein [Noviherbaspirillum aerium]|uniref:hypothetical protein n=1 Tax=Noviherbaspirillum aerium TaxID=2588497 RepID=UPI00124D98B1|nr:hypothetical protein [Noviherbaspirillum aerium]